MAEGNSDQSDLTAQRENDQLTLTLISQGHFRCPPCPNCQNSNPFLLEIPPKTTQNDLRQRANSYDTDQSCSPNGGYQVLCKNCSKPYTIPDDNNDDCVNVEHGLGIECCNCENKKPELFSVTRREGQIHKVTCLVCFHGNTFHDIEGHTPLTPEGIECAKCPNTQPTLFEITRRDDGRVHKVTCRSCGHGNTFHDPGEPRRDNSHVHHAQQSLSDGSSSYMDYMNPLKVAWNAVAWLAKPAAQSALNQGAGQVVKNLVNNRPLDRGLRQIGVGQLAALGENLVVQLGNRYLKGIVSQTLARGVAVNVGDLIRGFASEKVEQTRRQIRKRGQLQQQSLADH